MIFRPFRLRDASELLEWFPTARDLAQWGSPARRFPLDEAQIGEFFALTGGDRPKSRIWAGEEDGRLAATATTWLDWEQGNVRLAMVGVSPAMRGRGLALPFLRQVVATVFAEPEFERIDLNVYVFNEAAIRTYEKLGFVREGLHRRSARIGDERWDTAHYAMLRDDWRG